MKNCTVPVGKVAPELELYTIAVSVFGTFSKPLLFSGAEETQIIAWPGGMITVSDCDAAGGVGLGLKLKSPL
jgi:hypothetical protein